MNQVENIEDHLAHTCKCGSVNFALLKSGQIECNKCGEKQGDARWGDGPLGCQIRRAIAAEDALRQAIEQAEKVEPVLVVARHDLEKLLKRPEGDKHIKAFIPPGMGDEVLLYTHPPTAPAQQPLSYEESWAGSKPCCGEYASCGRPCTPRGRWEAQQSQQPLSAEQIRDLVKECGLDWHRGFYPLFDGDETNRFAVLVQATETAHGIKGETK
jgi:hypothetical protein